MENRNDVKYAGFFTRLLATLVDIAAISFVINIVGNVITLNAFIVLVISWLYISVMIIRWRTTIGGKLFGIEVLKSDDLEPLSFKWASLRFFLSIAPFLIYLYLRGIQHIMDMPPSPTMSQLPQLIFILLPMLMFFTKKKQMIHDFIVHSVVIDVNAQIHIEKIKENKFVHVGQKILRVVGTLVFLAIFGYLLIYVAVFYKLGKSSYNRYNASFSKQYTINDYNDSKIIFYNKELEKYSEKFINANGMYDIFEADVKKDLALGCIEYFIKRKNRDSWLDEGSKYRKNARNKYANTEDKIKKAKNNSNYMGKHFYTFDLNMVSHIEDDITETWSDKNESICEQKLSTDNMYKVFVKKYTWQFPSSVCYDKKGKKWFELFEQKQPQLSKEAKLEKLKREKEDRIYVEKMQKEEKLQKTKEKQKDLWKSAETGVYYGINYFDGVNTNLKNGKGETPLIVAVKNGHSSFIDYIHGAIVNVRMKDHNGKTAFDYIKKPKNKREEMFSIRIYTDLRQLEVHQIISDKARIVEEEINLQQGIYKLSIEGATCEEFALPKDIQCITLETKKLSGTAYEIYEHDINRGVPPIFAAIQNRLYKKLSEILDSGADIEMKNKFNDTPLIFALYQNHDKLVKILLEYDANPNVMDGDGLYTALSKIIVTNRISTAKLLLEYGADVNYQYNKSETALTVASKGCKNFDMVKLLLNNGADPKLMDRFGNNTLTGLKSYCRDDILYKKMKNLIEKSNL